MNLADIQQSGYKCECGNVITAPNGFTVTGEYRIPNTGEWYLHSLIDGVLQVRLSKSGWPENEKYYILKINKGDNEHQ